eukprot:scaffold18079_cov65-Phaeocystis_antarctica.AAC.4
MPNAQCSNAQCPMPNAPVSASERRLRSCGWLRFKAHLEVEACPGEADDDLERDLALLASEQ